METLFEHVNILVLTKPFKKEDHTFVLPPQIPVLKKARLSKNHQLFLIQEPHHALEAAMRLQHQHPTQSIALGHGHVLCIEDQPNHSSYHGDSLHELVQLMPKLPTGHPILTSAFYERLLPWEDDDILLSPIQQQTLTPLMNTLYTLHEQDTQPHKIRSNINHINTSNFAHTHYQHSHQGVLRTLPLTGVRCLPVRKEPARTTCLHLPTLHTPCTFMLVD